jgi:hypothetical protein
VSSARLEKKRGMVQRGGEGGALAAITNWEQQPNVAGPKATDAAVYTDTGLQDKQQEH